MAADPSSNQTINFKNDDKTEDAADKPTIMSLKDIVQGQPLMQSYFYDEVFEPFLNEVFFVHGFSNEVCILTFPRIEMIIPFVDNRLFD